MSINRELEQVISNAMFGKDTEELDLGEASKFVKLSEKIVAPLVEYVASRTNAKFRFKMHYYYKDVSGYYFDTGKRTPIEVKANTKAEAYNIVANLLPASNGRSGFKLHVTILEIEQL